jgi:ligand-binding sensor domain-containing protein
MTHRRHILVLIATVLFALESPRAAGQSPITLTNWSVISSYQTVRDVAVDDAGLLWVATSGGVYVTDTSGVVRQEYRTIDALQAMDVTAIACDRTTGMVIVGGETGALDLRSPDGTWTNITDIRRAIQYPRKGIRDFATRGSVLYMATDFGVLTFDVQNKVFLETIDRIGPLQEKTRANALAIVNDSLWVATDSGVVVAPLDVPTLRLPSVWTLLPDPPRNQARVRYLVAHRLGAEGTQPSTIAIASDSTVFVWSADAWQPTFSCPMEINGLTSNNGVLRASCLDGLYTQEGFLPVNWGGNVLGHVVEVIASRSVIMAFPYERSLRLYDGRQVIPVVVNTPLSNQFARMSIDAVGGLWVATDVDPPRSGQGVARLHDGLWTTYTAANTPAFSSNAAYRVQSFPNGITVIGTWGGGAVLARIESDRPVFEGLTSSNSAFQGIANSPGYVLAAEAAIDRSGTIWVVNEQAAQQLLVSIDDSRAEGSVGYANCLSATDNLYRSLAIDNAGTKWVGGFNNQGLLAFQDRDTPSTADDVCQVVRSSTTQLPDNTITVLRTDRIGAIWIGTPKGVAVMASPTSVSNTSVPFVRRITALTSVVVNDIFVDALNYKWIATTSGVFVLNEDGTDVLATITTSNAPLPNENVRSVVVDNQTGTVYLGTSTGCAVASSSSVAPAPSFELTVRPLPFSHERDTELLIDGLAADADLRIVTINGTLIHAQKARGRQAVWNGRDLSGAPVAPGVYVLHATSTIDQSSAVAKIVVTR